MPNGNKKQKQKPRPPARRPKAREEKGLAAAYTQKVSLGSARITQRAKTTKIVHSELLGAVSPATAGFEGVVYYFNPGLLPWAGSVASRYETYIVNSARIEYVPNVPTTASGNIYFFADYDVIDNEPTDAGQLMQNFGAISSTVWKSFGMRLDPTAIVPKRNYTRDRLIAGVDLKLYDACTIGVFTEGTSVAQQGNVYIHYDISLFTPQPSFELPESKNISTIENLTSQNPDSGVAAAVNWAGSVKKVVDGLKILETIQGPFSQQWKPPAGTYQLLMKLAHFVDTGTTAFSNSASILKDGATIVNDIKTVTNNAAAPQKVEQEVFATVHTDGNSLFEATTAPTYTGAKGGTGVLSKYLHHLAVQ